VIQFHSIHFLVLETARNLSAKKSPGKQSRAVFTPAHHWLDGGLFRILAIIVHNNSPRGIRQEALGH
jgi:hypothetical protein